MRTSAERVSAIRAKAERSRKHIDEAGAYVQSYLQSNPYRIATRRDPETRRLHYYVSSITEPSQQLSAIIGDALHNLRSTLDHLAYQLVLVGTGQLPSRRVYFPVCDDQAKYASEGRQQVQGAKLGAISAIDAIKPYKGGNTKLWQLHQLNNVEQAPISSHGRFRGCRCQCCGSSSPTNAKLQYECEGL